MQWHQKKSKFNITDSLVQGLGRAYQDRTFTGAREQFWLPPMTHRGNSGSWTQAGWVQVHCLKGSSAPLILYDHGAIQIYLLTYLLTYSLNHWLTAAPVPSKPEANYKSRHKHIKSSSLTKIVFLTWQPSSQDTFPPTSAYFPEYDNWYGQPCQWLRCRRKSTAPLTGLSWYEYPPSNIYIYIQGAAK